MLNVVKEKMLRKGECTKIQIIEKADTGKQKKSGGIYEVVLQ